MLYCITKQMQKGIGMLETSDINNFSYHKKQKRCNQKIIGCQSRCFIFKLNYF